MDNPNIQRLIETTCRQFATKLGNDLQVVHDSGCAAFRRLLNSFARTLEAEFRSRQKDENAKSKEDPENQNGDGQGAS